MSLGITNNITSGGLLSRLKDISNAKSSNIKKLSSGLRINKASDDAAGMAISIRLIAKATALSQASQNTSGGLSMMQMADSGLSQISDMLNRAKELSVQSANSALDDTSRQAINTEFNAIVSEVSRIANTTGFGGQELISGDLSSGSANRYDIQVGDSDTTSDSINLNVIEGATALQLGIDSADISTVSGAQNAITAIDSAIDQVSATMANIGATQNRLSFASANLDTSIMNTMSAASEIRDIDFASEATSLAQNRVGQEVAISALKIANKTKSQMIGKLLNVKG